MTFDFSTKRKTQVLVWMQEYYLALEEGVLAKDADLINLVLIKFFDEAD
jgi:hypothetical protein